MDKIEILKKNLNREKVFNHLNWHELVLDESSDDSNLQNYESFKSYNDLFSYSNENNKESNYMNIRKVSKENERLNYKLNKKYYDNNSRSENTEGGEEISETNENAQIYANNEKKCDFFQKNYIFSYFSSIFSKNKKYEIKRCYFIKEVKIDKKNKIDFIPQVDILYDDEKVLFLFYISGLLENFNVFSENNYITISGRKIPYEEHKINNYSFHEIKKGFFMRTYCFMKSIDKEKIYYEHKNGIIKIFVYVSNDSNL